MKILVIATLLLSGLISGCAMFSEQARMEEYGRIIDAYATAMRLSDFNAVCQFVDPSTLSRQACLDQFENVKIVDYQVTHVTVSDDQRQVQQEIKVDYFFLDNYVLKTVHYEQSWQFQPESKSWLLQSHPPRFE